MTLPSATISYLFLPKQLALWFVLFFYPKICSTSCQVFRQSWILFIEQPVHCESLFLLKMYNGIQHLYVIWIKKKSPCQAETKGYHAEKEINMIN